MLEVRKPDSHGNQRLILVRTGGKRQSVNLCGLSNLPGEYQGWVYFQPPYWVDAGWFAKFSTFEATAIALRQRDYNQHS